MAAKKITKATLNRKKRAIEIELNGGDFLSLPYQKLKKRPSTKDPLHHVEADGDTVFYIFKSGKKSSVALASFEAYNRDPIYLRDMVLHQLTLDAMNILAREHLSKHEITRRLGTSPSQLYRLLDPTNYSKSVDEMLRLVAVLGAEVEIKVTHH